MHTALRFLQRILLGAEQPPRLEEERYPLDAAGRPDLSRFTRSAEHYAGYVEDYLASLDTRASARGRPSTAAWQAHAYRKGVLGQWGLIARGPDEALPIVLRLSRHRKAEGRQAASGALDAWAAAGLDLEAPALAAAERELASPERDVETLGVLFGVLARTRSAAALPLLARVLRAPESAEGDLDWSALEALEGIAGSRFTGEADPRHAAREWLAERGL